MTFFFFSFFELSTLVHSARFGVCIFLYAMFQAFRTWKGIFAKFNVNLWKIWWQLKTWQKLNDLMRFVCVRPSISAIFYMSSTHKVSHKRVKLENNMCISELFTDVRYFYKAGFGEKKNTYILFVLSVVSCTSYSLAYRQKEMFVCPYMLCASWGRSVIFFFFFVKSL